MSDARSTIFSSIRRSLGVSGAEPIRQTQVAERLERAPIGVIPARAQIDPDAKLALLLTKLEAAQATYVRVGSPHEVPAAIADYLRANNLPATLRHGSDPRLSELPWGSTALELAQGRSDGHDLNAVSHADAGIAETGTLALVSGPENPTTLNFLPDNHIVVMKESDLVGDLEQVWARVRQRYGKGEMPRTVNFVTGPSRSGDIEQTILLGAHGPRRLHVVLVAG